MPLHKKGLRQGWRRSVVVVVVVVVVVPRSWEKSLQLKEKEKDVCLSANCRKEEEDQAVMLRRQDDGTSSFELLQWWVLSDDK